MSYRGRDTPIIANMQQWDGYGSDRVTERSRWTPLTRMLLSGEMTQEKQKELSKRERFDRWMINEGYRRLYVLAPGSK